MEVIQYFYQKIFLWQCLSNTAMSQHQKPQWVNRPAAYIQKQNNQSKRQIWDMSGALNKQQAV